MSTSNIFPSVSGQVSHSPLTGFWHSPTLTVARFTLKSYIRSGWILGNIVFIWLLYAIFYLEFGGDTIYFFGTANPGLGLLAVLGTIVMAQRAVTARMYLPLARLTSRAAYIRGLIIASSVFWLLCVLYSNSGFGIVAQYLSWTRIPLAPFIVCFNLATTGIANWYDAAMVLIALGYIVGLTLLAQFWFSRRDLILY